MAIERIKQMTSEEIKDAVYQIILSHCATNTYCNQTNYFFGQTLKIRPEFVSKAIKQLEDEGLVEIKGANVNFRRNRKIYIKKTNNE